MLLLIPFYLPSPKGEGIERGAEEIRNAKIDWECLILALSEVESENNDKAYNPASGALGRLQMKTIYVDEVNRILKLRGRNKRYFYKDRLNAKKSREMFEIYQSHHNPDKNINRAIRIHRGKHSPKYRKKVLEVLEENKIKLSHDRL